LISVDFFRAFVLELSQTMVQRRSAVIAVGMFLVFLFVLLTVNFFHTEKSFHPSESCPACHFQQSSLSVGPALPVQLPPLFLIAILPCLDSFHKAPVFSISLSSRSPPLS
jgi:hypothetical protein